MGRTPPCSFLGFVLLCILRQCPGFLSLGKRENISLGCHQVLFGLLNLFPALSGLSQAVHICQTSLVSA